jgi:hypothetical protein
MALYDVFDKPEVIEEEYSRESDSQSDGAWVVHDFLYLVFVLGCSDD